MITIQEFLEIINYRITGGSNYGWQCFGANARWLDCEVEGQYSANIVFDAATQEVYTAEISDYRNDRCYRLINPDYVDAHNSEAKERGVDIKQAWDEVKWVDLETDDDWIQKSVAIVAGNDYDTRVSIPIDLSDETVYELMKLAHEQDITFNQLIETVLSDAIDKYGEEGIIDELRKQYDREVYES
jgi:hypothetical protein